MTRFAFIAAGMALAAVALTAEAGAAPSLPCGLTPSEPASVVPDQRFWSLFDRYGDDNSRTDDWTGADTTNSVVLPDGRIAWIFSDTFLGTVNPDHTRPLWPETPLINNSFVIQEGSQLVGTVRGGTESEPASLIGDAPGSPTWYWLGDGTVEGDELQVFATHWEKFGPGMWDWRWLSNFIGTFSLPELELQTVTVAPGRAIFNGLWWGSLYWGAGLLEEGDYTYVYGSADWGFYKQAQLARVPSGRLLEFDEWTYWNGSGWSSDPDSSATLAAVSAAGEPGLVSPENEYSVTKFGRGYLLLTLDGSEPFLRDIVAYFSCDPAGPWVGPYDVYTIPENAKREAEADPRPGVVVYNAHAHPEFTNGSNVLVSYNVNTLAEGGYAKDVHIYRPRFIRVHFPPGVVSP